MLGTILVSMATGIIVFAMLGGDKAKLIAGKDKVVAVVKGVVDKIKALKSK